MAYFHVPPLKPFLKDSNRAGQSDGRTHPLTESEKASKNEKAEAGFPITRKNKLRKQGHEND